ncbi:STAS domain-containing protein [Comamonas sp. Y33R10-2]|uniref:STAS domain-containing protein n=1 Tax=Comamonas sp. Y33R10-2 TaxID=2853257 RepID=UPI001C5CAC1A|nr:STAS domain-containing protein [Comamonas sp. Y33R10-2]QXZ09884.1 STAS domain-containing protein [Comamonas sp. Y33R10-2]
MAKSATHPLQLPKELTYRQGRDCLLRLRPLVTAHADAQVVVDASAVKVFDSAALAVLLACRRAAQEVGKQLIVTGLPKGLQSMAALYGVDVLLLPPLMLSADAAIKQG